MQVDLIFRVDKNLLRWRMTLFEAPFWKSNWLSIWIYYLNFNCIVMSNPRNLKRLIGKCDPFKKIESSIEVASMKQQQNLLRKRIFWSLSWATQVLNHQIFMWILFIDYYRSSEWYLLNRIKKWFFNNSHSSDMLNWHMPGQKKRHGRKEEKCEEPKAKNMFDQILGFICGAWQEP